MGAPKGNKYWEERRVHGRKKAYETPQDLWNAAIDYFQWVEQNPLKAAELVKFQGTYKTAKLPVMRAMTEAEFVEHSLIGWSTWDNYSSGNDSYKDFLEVTTRIKQCIRNQKFQGAAADLLNANIIARDLGLRDSKDITAKVTYSDDTDEELASRIRMLTNEPKAIIHEDT